MDVGLSESLLAMGESLGGEAGESESPMEAFAATESELAAHPDVISAESSEYTEAGIRHLVMDVTVKDFLSLPELHRETMNAAEGEEPVESMFEFREAGKNRVRFVQTMGMGGAMDAALDGDGDDGAGQDTGGGDAGMDDGLDAGMGDAGEDFAKGMMAMMFEGKSFSVTLHAPKIEATNGELAEDGQSVTWDFPFAELVMDEGEIDALEAEVVLSKSLGEKLKGLFGKD
jgi:hypothetical protein